MIKIKVAVISDVHGNSIALEEVLKDAKSQGVTEFIFPGDLVNDLPFGNETMEIIKNTSTYLLKGNKEEYLLEYERSKYEWTNMQFKNTLFMYQNLSKENMDLIKKLPMTLDLEFEGINFKIAHGSPESIEEQIHETRGDLIEKYTKNLKQDVLVFGHTHEPVWYKKVNGKLIVNAGCMGVTPYYLSQAEYIILHIENNNVKVEKRLVHFSTEKIKEKILKCGILQEDKVLMSLTYAAITGNGKIRHQFFTEAKQAMKDRNHCLYKEDAKGIYKYFKLYDDDIWLGLYEKYKTYFAF